MPISRQPIYCVAVLLFLTGLLPAATPATLPAAPASQTQPPGDAMHDILGSMVRQALADSLAIPCIKDGKVEGAAARTNDLLQFLVNDYKHRTGPRAEGPAWQALTYTLLAYDPAAITDPADGTGSIIINGWPAATYVMIVLSDPECVQRARVHAVMTDKNGGLYSAFWDMQWTAKGWHQTMSSTPTAAVLPRLPAAVK